MAAAAAAAASDYHHWDKERKKTKDVRTWNTENIYKLCDVAECSERLKTSSENEDVCTALES